MTPDDQARPRFITVLTGIAMVARGQKAGLAQFGNTPQAVLAALTPLAAFLLVGAAAAVFGGSADAVADVAAVSIGLLGPLVLSYEVARRWDRAAAWPRFAAAFLWCQWAAPVVLALILVVMATLMAGGLPGDDAASLGILLMFGYGLWLHWFVARHALEISRLRAAMLVLMVNVATMTLISLPQVIDYMVNGSVS